MKKNGLAFYVPISLVAIGGATALISKGIFGNDDIPAYGLGLFLIGAMAFVCFTIPDLKTKNNETKDD
jgi:hypothetical protein